MLTVPETDDCPNRCQAGSGATESGRKAPLSRRSARRGGAEGAKAERFDKMRGRGETVMKKLIPHMTALAIALAAGSYLVFAQQPGRGGPPPPMSFFITSVPKGDGANYGG